MISITQQLRGQTQGFREHYARIHDTEFDLHSEVIALRNGLEEAEAKHRANVAVVVKLNELIEKSKTERNSIKTEIASIEAGRPALIATAYIKGGDFSVDIATQARIAELRQRHESLELAEQGLQDLLKDARRSSGITATSDNSARTHLAETLERLKFEKTLAEYHS